ncbi:hypothetical protein MMC21_001303 [Puttea exsequens]|nr:hypothetical protein [Puttea exsequens]
MSDYPSLQPAMTLHVELGGVTPVGSHSRGTALDIAAMTGGSLKSEPGLSPTLDCEWSGQGEDYIHRDPDGKRMRLDAHAAVR